ncbi:flavodoxin [Desulfosporosinus fructosivorans]|uniref:Flavodoxin n=1 Tax=Desulfosporosinus fructosivorans TaxID=2018669 RepID=A0A4Z0RAN6_9FIRM|nr:flavodoxin [Desulfosporosinus fructosivorans]TGE39217.1 flavodoxin [Desulfosporosinus fructosivorans]
MKRRKFIVGAGAGLAALMLGGCGFLPKDNAQQNVAPAEKDSNKLTAEDSNIQTSEENNTQTSEKEKKILIAYFSHTGHTNTFAEIIQKEVGSDLFAIEPQDAYPIDHDTVVQQARGEVDSQYKPKLSNQIPDIRSYDIIFIGTPIWWYSVAPPVRTFLTDYDLADKTIIPFSTHKGSGLSGIDKTMQELQPKTKVLEGLAIWDDQAKDKQADIVSWLQRLNV